VAWWSNAFPNLVQQMTYSLQGTPSPTALWSSTGTGTGAPPGPPTAVGRPWPESGISLRTNLRAGEVMDLQTARIGKVIPGESTLNGEFVVFGQTNGMINPTPLFQTIVEGQLGAFNSIVVGDLDTRINSTDKKEVYIASSTGVRKFYVP
jgi:hypothetical protein